MRSIAFWVSLSVSVCGGLACGKKGSTPGADGSMNGTGGSSGTDARLDATDAGRDTPSATLDAAGPADAAAAADRDTDAADASRDTGNATPDAADANRDGELDAAALDGPADRAPALDAPSVDVSADGLADRLPDAVVDGAGPDLSGGPGCGSGSLCAAIRAAYSEAILTAQSCSGGDSCALSAVGSLGCLGCPVWVSNKTELDTIRGRFNAAGCQVCVYGSPTGDRCHPIVCPDLGTSMCAVGPSGRGTCVDRPKDRTCPSGIMTGKACTATDDYCVGGGNVCTCTRATMTWSC